MGILDEAQSLTEGERNDYYGHPAEDFGRTATMWSAILGVDVTAQQVAMCMVCVKLSRECHRPKRDNRVDAAGYLNCLQMVIDRRAETSQAEVRPERSDAGTEQELRRPPVIYIAGPYSNGDPVVNTRAAMDVWHKLHELGATPVCPHWSLQQHMVTHLTWEQWLRYDERIIERCDWLYRMPGESRGADREVKHALSRAMRVYYQWHSVEAAVKAAVANLQ